MFKTKNLRNSYNDALLIAEIKQEIKDLMKQLYLYFEREVEVPRIRIGKRQTIETLISEEVLQFSRYLRGELESWSPRIPILE